MKNICSDVDERWIDRHAPKKFTLLELSAKDLPNVEQHSLEHNLRPQNWLKNWKKPVHLPCR